MNNFYDTIVNSKEWKDWEENQRGNKGFDVDESREADILSEEHWKAFVEFIKEL